MSAGTMILASLAEPTPRPEEPIEVISTRIGCGPQAALANSATPSAPKYEAMPQAQ